MRVIAMKCDRCGKVCDYYEVGKTTEHITSKETNEANEFTLINMRDMYSDRKAYDLCPECMREFKKFLENK